MRLLDRRCRLAVLGSLLAVFATSTPAAATPITPSGWYGFEWGGTLPVGTSGAATFAEFTPVANPGGSPWTFTLTDPTNLVVVDGFLSSDRFEAFNFGVSLGLTSLVAAGEGECAGGNDPLTCLADSRFSSGVFLLAPGNYQLTIQAVAGLTSGGSYFGFQSVSVPEPASIALLAIGAAGALVRRRRA